MKRFTIIAVTLLAGCHKTSQDQPQTPAQAMNAQHEAVKADLAKRQWPDTECPRKGEWGGMMGDGWHQYKIVEVSPGHCQWQEDIEAEKQIAEVEQERKDLYWAMRTRVLTEKEMERVRQYGKSLNVDNGESYNERDKMLELDDAYRQQFLLREIAAGHKKGTGQ